MNAKRFRTSTLVAALTVMTACAGPLELASTESSQPAPAPDLPAEANTGTHAEFHPIEPVDTSLYWADSWTLPVEDLDEDGVAGNTNSERLSALPVEAAHVRVLKSSAQGRVSTPVGHGSAAGSEYVVILDYVKYRTDETASGCLVQTGVGVRMRAQVKTLEAGVDVSTPFALGAAATAGKLEGTLSFQTIGVHGKAISPLVPLPSRLSEESIQLGIVSAGAIKASLYTDGDVLIRPQVFGHKPEAKCRGVGTSTSHGSTALAVEAQPNHTPLRD